jgi:hypothetical protein
MTLVTWQEVPAEFPPGYLNIAKPRDPNVRIDCSPAIRVRLPFGLTRSAEQLGVRVAAPAGFVQAW